MNAEEIARAKEDQIRFQTFESAFAWDAQGNPILAKDGQQYEVAFSPQECLTLKDAIMTHNHPHGLNFPDSDPQSAGNSFSPEDIAFVMAYDLAEIRVVTPKLRFAMKRLSSGWSHSDWITTVEPLFELVTDTVLSEFDNAIDAGQMTEEEANVRHYHEIWLRVSQQLGLDYRREEN